MGFPKYQTVVIVGFSRRVPQQEHVFVESFFEILQDFIDFYSIYFFTCIFYFKSAEHTFTTCILFENIYKSYTYMHDYHTYKDDLI